MPSKLVNTIAVLLLLFLLFSGSSTPISNTPDMVAVVYESSDGIPKPYVTGALNKLNEQGFQVRIFDKDVVTGEGEIPAQIQPTIQAAVNNGLPALVVLSKGEVISVRNLPKSESEILEAVK
jgi:hypothetical protein